MPILPKMADQPSSISPNIHTHWLNNNLHSSTSSSCFIWCWGISYFVKQDSYLGDTAGWELLLVTSEQIWSGCDKWVLSVWLLMITHETIPLTGGGDTLCLTSSASSTSALEQRELLLSNYLYHVELISSCRGCCEKDIYLLLTQANRICQEVRKSKFFPFRNQHWYVFGQL